MKLVVDTSIIVSALLKDSTSRAILLNPKFDFYSPEFVFHEIGEHEGEIIERSNISKEEFHVLLNTVLTNIGIIPREEFVEYMPKALDIMKNIDENDSPFIALALSFSNDGIWSEDEHFSKQGKVKVWKTKEIVEKM